MGHEPCQAPVLKRLPMLCCMCSSSLWRSTQWRLQLPWLLACSHTWSPVSLCQVSMQGLQAAAQHTEAAAGHMSLFVRLSNK